MKVIKVIYLHLIEEPSILKHIPTTIISNRFISDMKYLNNPKKTLEAMSLS